MAGARVAALTLVVCALAACAGEDDPGVVEESPAATVSTSDQVGVDLDATNVSNYGIAYDICSSESPEHLAAELGAASTEPIDIANAYAAGYTERFRSAGFEGCVDALTGAPRQLG